MLHGSGRSVSDLGLYFRGCRDNEHWGLAQDTHVWPLIFSLRHVSTTLCRDSGDSDTLCYPGLALSFSNLGAGLPQLPLQHHSVSNRLLHLLLLLIALLLQLLLLPQYLELLLLSIVFKHQLLLSMVITQILLPLGSLEL